MGLLLQLFNKGTKFLEKLKLCNKPVIKGVVFILVVLFRIFWKESPVYIKIGSPQVYKNSILRIRISKFLINKFLNKFPIAYFL